jgi:adenine phosphoribosyltransferase
MLSELLMKQLIRDVPDFPAPGVLFRDITPVLQDPAAFKDVIDSMVECVAPMKADVIVGIESRGFVLGAPIAMVLGLGFVPVRKAGKLPADTIRAEYALEYGTNAVEIHRDAIEPGMRIAIVDDLLATGGTAKAAVDLVEELGGKIAGLNFLIELEFLHGRVPLTGYEICTLIRY